jgi:hypothetical protein
MKEEAIPNPNVRRKCRHKALPAHVVRQMRPSKECELFDLPRNQSVSRNSKLRDRHELRGVDLLPIRRSYLSVGDVEKDM